MKSLEQRKARVRFGKIPLADASRFQVELWLFLIVLEDDDNTNKAAGLTLCAGVWIQHCPTADIS